MPGRLIWADLSTFDVQQAQAFYAKVFGWVFDQGVAYHGDLPAALIYDMPHRFQEMGLPSFWMSYIAVSDCAASVALARALGGRVELGPTMFDGGGQYALIRDPLGAGFTIYDGTALDGAYIGPLGRVGHGLFVSDTARIADFYAGLFGWSFGKADRGVRPVTDDAGEGAVPLFHCHEIADQSLRGSEEYWAVYFAHPDLEAAGHAIGAAGGKVMLRTVLPEGSALFATDPSGAFFGVVEAHGRV